MRRILSAVFVGFVSLGSVHVAAAESVVRQLIVTGEGVSEAAPDMATITVGVTFEATTAAEALGQTSVATGEMLTLLSEIGVEQRDMQTTNLRLNPVWDNRKRDERPVISGYQASNNVVVRIRSLGDLGVILDDIVQNGANEFYGLNFGLQNPGPVQDAAREAAVAETIRKAKLYAAAAGVELGAILSISEAGASAPSPVALQEFGAARSAPVPIAQGELSISAQVTIVFEIASE